MLSMTSSHIDIVASPEKSMVVTSTIEGSNMAYIKVSDTFTRVIDVDDF
jgi:hypothetical protein